MNTVEELAKKRNAISNIRVNELMLGDWVFSLHHNKPIQITPYDFFTHSHKDGIQSFEGIRNPIPSLGTDLFPILLTAEILEKNGLRKITLDGEKGSKQDYYIDTQFVGYYNMNDLARVHTSPIVYDIKQKWLFVNDNQTCRLEFMCPYVHTLQHALKLCEINKEIVL